MAGRQARPRHPKLPVSSTQLSHADLKRSSSPIALFAVRPEPRRPSGAVRHPRSRPGRRYNGFREGAPFSPGRSSYMTSRVEAADARRGMSVVSAEWSALYAEHAPGLSAFLTKLTGDREVAAELMQETFVRAMRAHSVGTAVRSSRAWL